ncbi:hypothetical protein DUNSADRAFT_572 [Dunaliella salina]|uniref:COP9 signalosome complex subunit 3 n=1 Tax=Dunaliella salina TaxID=3046 RepID=A0ABQ7FYP3_DUNSA|nr:hypothetical protein DUNSADRAFT_572 [Dunaliella salina]|eukprot:KAF5827482.1 hypothetical protein DUNSADRAFT_572 [Dunaliella salina]
MEGVVAHIQALSNSPGDLSQLVAQLRTQTPQLIAHATAIPDAVQTLEPGAHSLGMSYLLDAWCRAGLNQNGDAIFINSTSRLLQEAQPQIRTSPDVFCRVCRAFKDQVIAAGCPRMGILPLISAIRSLQESSDMLTPMHADCFQLCLLSKCYNASAKLLEDDIYNVDPSRTACTPQDLLLYSYYGGMLCTGRKQYARALELFMLGLTAPSMTRSAIALAIFKKHVLVSLIHLGHLPALPKFAPQSVRSMADAEARFYLDLAQAYATHSSQKLARSVESHAQAFEADGNMGLVQLVVSSLATRSIQRLTQTYLTLSLADIASRVGLASPEQAEMHLIGMLQTGDIHASISEEDGGMVRFLEESDEAARSVAGKTDLARRLEAHIRKCMGVADRVQQLQDSVSTDREYLKKVGQKERARFDLGSEFEGFAGGSTMFQP